MDKKSLINETGSTGHVCDTFCLVEIEDVSCSIRPRDKDEDEDEDKAAPAIR